MLFIVNAKIGKFGEQDQIVSKFATFLYRVFEYNFEHYNLIYA